jgi:hypothetical protein
MLKKYEPCASFSSRDWLLSLEERVLVGYRLTLDSIDLRGPEPAKQSVDRLLDDPIEPCRAQLDAMGLLKTFESRAVRDLRVWEYFSATESIGDERLKAYADAYRKYVSGPSSDMTEDELRRVEAPVWSIYPETGLWNATEAHVHVNLECGEAKAVEDFRAWFRDTKKAQGIWSRETRISEAEMREWARFQVLAYIDLQLWAQANSREITHQVMGNSLFPNEFDTQLSDRVRKVVLPLCQKLLRREFCGILRSQVLGDLSEAEQRTLGPLPE